METSTDRFSPERAFTMALDFLAGLLGGAAGVLVGHPFDTVKVRLQTQPSGSGAKYKGTLHCFRCILKEESVVGLYKGISSPLAGLAFINAIVFGVYGNTLKALGENGDAIRSHFIAGSMAGAAQCAICSPMELAKLRLQLQGQGVRPHHIFFWADAPNQYHGPLDCLKQTYRSHGLRGVFRGLPVTIFRDLPCFGVYFASYEWMTRSMSKGGPETLTSGKLLLAGGAAGMISWLSLYPIDVVKSRYQADDKFVYKSTWDCVIKSYRLDGWRVFTQGMVSTLLRAFPTNAVTFFTVEWVFRLANGYLVTQPKPKVAEKREEINAPATSSWSVSNWSPNSNWLFLPLPEAGGTLLEPNIL